jgi:ComF family protein
MKKEILNNFLNSAINFFLPKLCAGCDALLKDDEIIFCNECNLSICRLSDNEIEETYNEKFLSENYISGLISLFLFEKKKNLQHAIHKLKYNERTDIGVFLGKKIIQFYSLEILDLWKIDIIIPVPLHKVKERERGYNQSFYIAKGISENNNLIIDKTSLQRVYYTTTQTKLNLLQRKSNIKNAFLVKDNNNIANKNILLVDDVVTTGSTINECARVLLENGAQKVYVSSIAIADK